MPAVSIWLTEDRARSLRQEAARRSLDGDRLVSLSRLIRDVLDERLPLASDQAEQQEPRKEKIEGYDF